MNLLLVVAVCVGFVAAYPAYDKQELLSALRRLVDKRQENPVDPTEATPVDLPVGPLGPLGPHRPRGLLGFLQLTMEDILENACRKIEKKDEPEPADDQDNRLLNTLRQIIDPAPVEVPPPISGSDKKVLEALKELCKVLKEEYDDDDTVDDEPEMNTTPI